MSFFLTFVSYSKTTMETTIIIKPNVKIISVLKKMVELKEQHRKEVLARLEKK